MKERGKKKRCIAYYVFTMIATLQDYIKDIDTN